MLFCYIRFFKMIKVIFSVIYYIPEALGLADQLQSSLKDHRNRKERSKITKVKQKI